MLDEAAEHARRRGAPETAAALAEQACLLTPPNGQRTCCAGRSSPPSTSSTQVSCSALVRCWRRCCGRHQPARERVEALRLLGEILSQEDSFSEAIRVLEEALEHVDDGWGSNR